MIRVAQHFCKTDTGRMRPANEDAYYAAPPIFVVADGMGGARAGEVASTMAVEAFQQPLSDQENTEQRLAKRALEANAKIYEHSRQGSEWEGMGTTLSVAYVDEADVVIAHVGDSRIYLLREGKLSRLTRDHSLVEELIRSGKLTEAEADWHPQRSVITRALGPTPEVEVDTFTVDAQGDDLFLACSDGLTTMVREARIGEILRTSDSLRIAAQRLVDEANINGGVDNITVILFQLEELDLGSKKTEGQSNDEQTFIVRREDKSSADIDTQQNPLPDENLGPKLAASGVATLERPVVQPDFFQPSLAPSQRCMDSSLVDSRPPDQRQLTLRTRVLIGLGVGLFIAALLVAGAWKASKAIYFIGTDKTGQVTIFQGIPYELPAGLKLYGPVYSSGVPAQTIPAAERRELLNHRLRSRSDANDLVRTLELGNLSP